MTRGIFDIPVIGFGPGQEEHAHTVQDQVKEADLVKAQEFYAAFVLEWAHADKQAVDSQSKTAKERIKSFHCISLHKPQ